MVWKSGACGRLWHALFSTFKVPLRLASMWLTMSSCCVAACDLQARLVGLVSHSCLLCRPLPPQPPLAPCRPCKAPSTGWQRSGSSAHPTPIQAHNLRPCILPQARLWHNHHHQHQPHVKATGCRWPAAVRAWHVHPQHRPQCTRYPHKPGTLPCRCTLCEADPPLGAP